MLFRLLNEPEGLPPLNNQRKMESYCGSLYTILSDDAKSLRAFKRCVTIIDDADFNMDDKQDLKLVSKTKNLIEYALANRG